MKQILIALLLLFAMRVDAQTVFARGMDRAPWMHEADNWSPLDGELNGAPDACGGPNGIVVVARGMDDAVWMNRRTGTAWSGWSSLGGPITSDPSVVCTRDGFARVFAQRVDRAVWTRDIREDDEWTSLGGQIEGAPDAAIAPSGAIDVVARGLDQAVWHIGWNTTEWSGWRSVGGRTASDPAIARLSDARAEIVIRLTDNTPRYGTLPASGNVTWQTLDGELRGSPDAASAGDGRMELVSRGTDNAVWQNTFDGARWSGWRSLGGEVSSDATVVPIHRAATDPGTRPVTATPPVVRPGGRYILELIGINVVRQSNDDALNRDGWADEVYMAPVIYRIAPDGTATFQGGRSPVFGQRTSDSVVQAGSARDDGGLKTGDTFPPDPTAQSIPVARAVHFRGELRAGEGGVLIIPALFEWDNRDELQVQFYENAQNAMPDVARLAAPVLASLRAGGDFSRFVRDGRELGLFEIVRWPGLPGPIDYPFGAVRSASGGMAFTPKVIVLTYEAAQHIVRTRFDASLFRDFGDGAQRFVEQTGAPGVFSIIYADEGPGFAGNYQVFFRLDPDFP